MALYSIILALVLALEGEPFTLVKKAMDGQEMDKATELVLDIIKEADEAGDKARKAEALCLLSTIDFRTWRDFQAWEHACEAEILAREVKIDTIIADALINKGKLCIYQNIDGGKDNSRDEEGLAWLREALKFSSSSILRQIEIQYNMAQAYIGMNRLNKPIDPNIYALAGKALEKGDSLALAAGVSPEQTQAYTYKVRYYRQGGNYKGGIAACMQTLEQTSDQNYLMKSQIYNHLVALYAMSGDIDKTVDAHQQCMNATQSYMKQKSDNLLQEMETKYHSRDMKKHITGLRGELFRRTLLILFLIAAIVYIIALYRKVSRQSKEIAAEAETKESLLQVISREFSDKVSLDEFHGMAAKLSKMSDDQIRSYFKEIFAGKERVASDVGEYFVSLVHERREKVSSIGLSERELEVIRYCREGLSNRQIAEKMFLSVNTIKNHKQRIFAKLNVRSVSELLSATERLGII